MRKKLRPCQHKNISPHVLTLCLFLSKGTLNTWETTKIMSNFSSETKIATLCRPSFTHALKLQCCTSRFVIYPGSFFALYLWINHLKAHPEIDMVSLLYTIVLWSNGQYLHKVLRHSVLTCHSHNKSFFHWYVDMKKISWWLP